MTNLLPTINTEKMSIDHAALALSWPMPNYEDPVTRGHTLAVISAVLVFVAGVAVGLRYLSHFLYQRFGKDDVCIAIAWVWPSKAIEVPY